MDPDTDSHVQPCRWLPGQGKKMGFTQGSHFQGDRRWSTPYTPDLKIQKNHFPGAVCLGIHNSAPSNPTTCNLWGMWKGIPGKYTVGWMLSADSGSVQYASELGSPCPIFVKPSTQVKENQLEMPVDLGAAGFGGAFTPWTVHLILPYTFPYLKTLQWKCLYNNVAFYK